MWLAETCYRFPGSDLYQGYAGVGIFLAIMFVISLVKTKRFGKSFLITLFVFGVIMILIGHVEITSDPVPCG